MEKKVLIDRQLLLDLFKGYHNARRLIPQEKVSQAQAQKAVKIKRAVRKLLAEAEAK